MDPFNSTDPFEFNSSGEESLIELSCDNSLKAKFGSRYRIDQILDFIGNKR